MKAITTGCPATNELGTSPLSDSDNGFHSPSRSPNDAFVDAIILEGNQLAASGTNIGRYRRVW